jgi:hypothetical protein
MWLSYVVFDASCLTTPAFARSSQTTHAKLYCFFDLPAYVTENSLSQSLSLSWQLSIITDWFRSQVLLAWLDYYRILLTITEPEVDLSGRAV